MLLKLTQYLVPCHFTSQIIPAKFLISVEIVYLFFQWSIINLFQKLTPLASKKKKIEI